jgi:NitT/TauT family transport system substrate-binding protein
MACAMMLCTMGRARADQVQTISVGTMRLTSAGGVIMAEAHGHFAQEGLAVQHVWSQAAQDTVMAAAAGSVDIAVGSFTASFYNLAGKGAFKIIWGQTQEVPGFRNNGFMVTNAAWDGGLRSLKDLPGHRIGITTTGGGLHYAIGLVARKYGFSMNQITMVPLQSFPNLAAAFKGGQIEAMAAASGVIAPLVPLNIGHVIGWSGDETPWQLGAVFVRPQEIARRTRQPDAGTGI